MVILSNKKREFDRFDFIRYSLIVLVVVLLFKLASLTIAYGDYYRDLADNKRIKEIYTSAPRGEIRDRYGRLLAGNTPSFTVQLLKDELNNLDKAERNEHLLQLVRFLEEDGVYYSNDYQIELNSIKFRDNYDYVTSDFEPIEVLINILIENNLIDDLLNAQFELPYENHYRYDILNNAKEILSKTNDVRDISDNETRQSYALYLSKLIENNKSDIRKILEHPIARLMAYELLESKGLQQNLILDEFSSVYLDDYIQNKASLMKKFDYITFSTTAEEDFINLFVENSLNSFLTNVINVNDNEKIIPGEVLISMIKDRGLTSPVEIVIDEEQNAVIYKLSKGNETKDTDPLELLIEFAVENDIIDEFIKSDEIKYHAQSKLISDGVNPKITVSKGIEYTFTNELKTWEKKNKLKLGMTVEEAFEMIKENNGINKEISKYEARSILGLLNQINSQGYMAYQPINIAYGIKDKTVAKIEENLSYVPGISISIEPVRYYPEGKTAAHILGYIGKISQDNEIEKYINQNGYSPNALIGKTGIEESYELELSGTNGVKKVEVDAVGNTANIIDEKKPIPGNNVYLTIDLKLQKVAEQALEQTLNELSKGGTFESKWGNFKYGINRRKGRPYIYANSGAVVVLDVNTGEVLAMASYPSYDVNLFATGISSSDWASLFPEDIDNPLAARPLYNIATQTAVQPGSTYKMVTALTALEKGLDPLLKIRDMGYVQVGDKKFHCLIYTNTGGTHGYENLYDAIADSCNYYFYTLALGRNQRTGEDIGVKVEIEDLVEMSKKLGLNDKTGIEINVPAEVSGGVPDPQKKIITTKVLLRNMLEENLRNYISDGKSLTDDQIDAAIEEIVSWTELDMPLSRGEVVSRLTEMGFDPEKRINSEREGLADKIKYTYLNQAGWTITDTLNVVIGQGQNAYTPIQMANYISTIANGGNKNKVTLIDSIMDYNNSSVLYKREVETQKIELNNYENLEHVKQGMLRVADDGSARATFQNFPVKVGVKTGTAERSGRNPYTNETFDDFAWFVGFAPYDNPEIAVAAVLFQGGSGGYAAPMVREIIAEYMGLNSEGVENSLPLENTILNNQ